MYVDDGAVDNFSGTVSWCVTGGPGGRADTSNSHDVIAQCVSGVSQAGEQTPATDMTSSLSV